MNLAKFNFVVRSLTEYYEENEILPLLEEVTSSLQSHISTASATEKLQLFRTYLDDLKKAARDVPHFSNLESFRSVIKETKGEEYFGENLESCLDSIVSNQGLMPAEILINLNEFKKELSDYIDKITTLADTFDKLDVEYDEIQFGQFEFSALLPKELIGNTVSDINKELSHLDKLFKGLNELLGYGATSPKVKTISSSWWQFFLELDGTQIAAITFAIERIVNLYKTSLEIKKLREETRALNLDKKITDLIEKEIDKKIKEGMKKISSELRKKFQKNDDDQRANELETQIRQELILVAKRLDQGAIYEVKAGIPNPPEELEESTDSTPQSLADFEKRKKVYQEELNKYDSDMKIVYSMDMVNHGVSEISSGIKLNETELITNYENIE